MNKTISGIFFCTLCLLLQVTFGAAQQPPKIVYVYDDLGRLAKVVDNTNAQCAIYNYDAVGNILSISRQTNCLAAPVVNTITPSSDPSVFIATGQNLLGATISLDLDITVSNVISNDNQLTFRLSGGGQLCSQTGNLTIATPTGSVTVPVQFTGASLLTPDVLVSAAISTVGEKDQYCFDLATPDRVVLKMAPTSSVNACLEVSSGTTQQPVGNGTACSGQVELNLAAGTYFVVARDQNNTQTGSYNILYERVGTSGVVALTADVPVSDAITPAGDLDQYTFTLDKTDHVVIQAAATTGSLSPCVTLYTGTPAQPVANGAACGVNFAQTVRLELNLAAGTYFVLVQAQNTGTGNYTILYERVGTAGGAVALTADVPVSGAIASAAGLDLYTFTLNTTDRVILQAVRTSTSGQLDLCVDLYTGTPAQPVASGTTCSRLELNLAPGTYFAVVRDRNITQTGSYNILAQWR